MKKTLAFLSLTLSVAFLTACMPGLGSQAEDINPKTQSSEYIEKITANGGLTDEEKAQRVRVSARELKSEIEALMDKTKDSEVAPDIVNEETAKLAVEWLQLVDQVLAPENNEELKTLLKEKLNSYSEEEFAKFREKLVQIANTALSFSEGNPSIVGLIRNAGINPNTVPSVYDGLEHWARFMFMD